MPPAVALILASFLGLALSIFNFAFSFTTPIIDPNAPQFIRDLQQGATGPLVAVVQGGFVVLNLLIIFGAVQMYRLRMWGLAVAVSIIAMANFGSCCCVVELPVGIWSLVMLMAPDVKAAFAAAGRENY